MILKKIYEEKDLKKMSFDELNEIFDEFCDFSSEYSHLLLDIIESKGG